MHASAERGGGDQDLLGLAPVLIGDGLGPPGQLEGDGLGEDVALGQGREQDLVAAGQARRAWYSAAWPLVTRVEWTSQVRVVR